jgi:hypothetical protein
MQANRPCSAAKKLHAHGSQMSAASLGPFSCPGLKKPSQSAASSQQAPQGKIMKPKLLAAPQGVSTHLTPPPTAR